MKVFLPVFFSAVAVEARTSSHAAANPIRRVVTLIQNLQKKVEADAVTEQKLFDEFMCYCKTGVGTLKDSISAAETKIPKVKASIEAAEAGVKQLRADLKQHKADRADAEDSSAKATALREKEAAAYDAFKTEAETNIGAMAKAISALEGAAGSSFVQTGTAQVLRQFVVDKASLADVDRDTVMDFLQGGDSEGSASRGQIDGILKQMKDTMAADLADATAEEKGSIKNFEGLIAANTKQIEAATVAIEEKSVRVGEVGVQTAEAKNDLKDTEEALAEDQAFLADLEKNCGTKEAEWAEIKKMRGEEIIALADTIKILNDDDALEMFKKTLPGASSFLQIQVSAAATRQRALHMIKDAEKKVSPASRHLDFIALALRGKKIGLDKVIKMCDDLVAVLQKEQEDDDAKKTYCEKEIDAAEDNKKVLEQAMADAETAIEDAKETMATAADEIQALETGIKDLDKQVEEATETRKAENAEYKELMANNGAAKELIGMAKNRMNKFYNPSQYKAPPKRELSAEDRAAAAAGEFVSISAHSQDEEDAAPPPPPSGPKAYSKKSEESNGVISMLNMLIQDLDKETQVAEVDEKNAQEEYEQMMADSSAKRKESKKQIADKKGARADAEEALQSHTDTKDKKLKENMGNDKVLSSLHAECDWLMQYFDVRKEARTSEIEAIGKAKAVLNGADFSLLQTSTRSLRGIRN